MKMKKLLTPVISLFSLAAAAASETAHIYEIRPWDYAKHQILPNGYRTSADPLTGGEFYFVVRLLNSGYSTSSEPTNPWTLQYVGAGSEAVDWEMRPPKIGIVVSGQTREAKIVAVAPDSTYNYYAKTPYTTYYTDVICSYTIEPGDFAMPVLLALDKNGTPSINDSGSGLVLVNDDIWRIQCTAGELADAKLCFATDARANTFRSPDTVNADPSGRTNYDMSQSGFYVKTIDFNRDTWRDKDNDVWRLISEGGTTSRPMLPLVSVSGTPAKSPTMYIWSDDPTAVDLADGEDVSMPSRDGTTTITRKVYSFQVDTRTDYTFLLKGVAEGKSTEIFLSQFKGFTVNKSGDPYSNYVTIPVKCGPPEKPNVTVTATTKVTAPLSADVSVPVGTLNVMITVSDHYTGNLDVTVTPEMRDGSGAWSDYVHIAKSTDPAAWTQDGTVTFSYTASDLAGQKTIEETVFVYALGADEHTSKVDGGITFTPVLNAAAASEYETNPGLMYVEPMKPVVAVADELTAVGNVPLKFEISLDDNYKNVTDAAGYKIEYKQSEEDSDWETLDGSWTPNSLGQLVKVGDPTVFPSLTYVIAGEYKTTFRITTPAGDVMSDVIGTTVTVKEAAKAWALVEKDGEFVNKKLQFPESDEESVAIQVQISRAYAKGDVWAFLAPKNEASATRAEGYPLTNAVISAGLKILTGETVSEAGDIYLLDGARGSGTSLSYDVLLCKTEEFDPDQLVPGYQSQTFQIVVTNVLPVVEAVTMNGGYEITAENNAVTAAMDVPNSFTFDVTDVDADLLATGADEFELQWKFVYVEGGGAPDGGTVSGNPNTASLDYTFHTPGLVRVTVTPLDKDIKDKPKTGVPFEFFVTVTDKPAVGVVGDRDQDVRAAGFDVEMVEGQARSLWLRLTENTAVENLQVRVTVTSGNPSATDPGTITLSGDTRMVEESAGVYVITLGRGEVLYEISVNDRSDGTKTSRNAGFQILAEVITDAPTAPGNIPWKDYYYATTHKVKVDNLFPYLEVPSLGGENSETNGFPVAIGSTDVEWAAFDESLIDLEAGLTVTWQMQGEAPVTETVTDSATRHFSAVFKTSGTKRLTATVTDKDGGKTSYVWYFAVEASKTLVTTANGPASTSTSALSQKYANAEGVGEGHVFTAGQFARAESFGITWNCGLVTKVNGWAYGYKVGDVDDGSLNMVATMYDRDVPLGPTGNNTTGGMSPLPDYYAYPDEVKDSFFYCWLISTTDENNQTDFSRLGALAPEQSAAVVPSFGVIPLPGEKTQDDNGYSEVALEAVFSKEYLPSDNGGDINQDGVPDLYISKYGVGLGLMDESGALTGDDLKRLSGGEDGNPDADYLPSTETAAYASFIPDLASSWIVAGNEFGAKMEIRGYDDHLNDAPQTVGVKMKTDINYADPDEDPTSTLSKLEWEAYVLAGMPAKWSPECPTDPTVADTDEDGMPDGYEYYIWYRAHVGYHDKDGRHKFLTGRKYNPGNPYEPIPLDAETIAATYNPRFANADLTSGELDTDDDGLPDRVEFELGTNPFDYDTDGDGLPDGYEVMLGGAANGFDPLLAVTDLDGGENDGTLNADKDMMASRTVKMHMIGMETYAEGVDKANGILEWYCSEKPFETKLGDAPKTGCIFTAKTDKIAAAYSFLAESDITGDVATLGTQKYLTKDLPATSVWKLEKFTVGGEEVLVKGAPTAIARGTELRGEIDEAGEYYEAEVASKPDLYFKAWKYPSISNTVTFARGAERVYSSDEFANRIVLAGAFMSKTNDVDLIHWQVYQEDKFDPRTAWMNKGEQSSTSTRAFTARDEFMAMAFYVHEGVLDRADLVATKQRPREQIWSEYVTNPLSADSDGDEVPDGWELYTMAGPKKYNKDTKDREGFNGPRSAYSPVVKFDAEHQDKDGDGLTIAGEFNAIDTVADYEEYMTIPLLRADWRNKKWPTDPWSDDTDGDGMTDAEEGEYFVYGTTGVAGGGLDPLSVDTDKDGLPDPWEAEFAGTWSNVATTKAEETEVEGSTNAVVNAYEVTWNDDGMDGTVQDAQKDYDKDGLANWQEYMVGAMRCWRYDDTVSTWKGQLFDKDDVAAAALGGDEAWGRFWYETLVDETSENYNPRLNRTGRFDLGIYFSRASKPWEAKEIANRPYMYRDGVDHELRNPPAKYKIGDAQYNKYTYVAAVADWGEGEGKGGCPYKLLDTEKDPVQQAYPHKYICCDPTRHDTDGDGMDDYYELFHGMNPLLGECGVSGKANAPKDIVYDAYRYGTGEIVAGEGESAASTTRGRGGWCNGENNWWYNPVANHREPREGAGISEWDFVVFPWLNGMATADPDGDNIRNQQEAIMPQTQAASTFLHTDPTPLWMTDTSYPYSLTSLYYCFPGDDGIAQDGVPATFAYNGTTYNFADFPGFSYDEKKQTLSFSRKDTLFKEGLYLFSFEQNEGYDTDHDFLGDYEEAQGRVRHASDPKNFDDPPRRQAMWFNGEDAFLQTPLPSDEEPGVSGMRGEPHRPFLYYTVECWAKPDESALDQEQTLVERAVWTQQSNLGDERLLRKNFIIGLKGGKWYTAFDTAGTLEKDTVEISDGPEATPEWTHVAASYDGTELRLYVNGRCRVTKATQLQPEHGIAAVSLRPQGGIGSWQLKYGLNRDTEYNAVSVLVGASAKTVAGVVFDTMYWGDLLVAPDVAYVTTQNDYDRHFKGYIDEVRLWDGARSPDEIFADCNNRVRYDAKLAMENRDKVYEAWRAGARREAGKTQLPAQLMNHWSFDHIPGAVKPDDAAKVPTGFDKAQYMTDAKALWSRPEGWVNWWWDSVTVRSSVFTDTAWVPWIADTVAHLPRLDKTTVDSVFRSEDFAGAAPASSFGYEKFVFPRSAEPYSKWTQQTYSNRGGATQRTRWDVISGGGIDTNSLDTATGSVTNELDEATSALVDAYRFTLRDRKTVGFDLLPMGGAYPRRISADEGGMWDDATPSDGWELSADDADNNGLPDVWEDYARQNYCSHLDPSEPLDRNTVLDYNGVMMPAWQALLRDIAAGLVIDGTKVEIKPEYAAASDRDGDGMPDWWEQLYGIDTKSASDADADADGDGLSNFNEYLIAEVYAKLGGIAGIAENFPMLNPTTAYSTPGQMVPDYFLRHGSLYLGELFSDHDRIEDTWEDTMSAAANRGETVFENYSRFVYDAHRDSKEEGWDNWSRARVAQDGHSYKVAVWDYEFRDKWNYIVDEQGIVIGYDNKTTLTTQYAYERLGEQSSIYKTNTVKRMVTKTRYYPDDEDEPYPHLDPVVSFAVQYNGTLSSATNMIVIKAWSETNTADPYMTRSPDAIWENRIVPDMRTHYSVITVAQPDSGYLRPGKNTFVVYLVRPSSGGDYEVGMPYGLAKGVNIGYASCDPFSIELTDVSSAMARINLADAVAKQQDYVATKLLTKSEEWWNAVWSAAASEQKDEHNADLAAIEQTIAASSFDRGVVDTDYTSMSYPEYAGTNVWTTSSNAPMRIRYNLTRCNGSTMGPGGRYYYRQLFGGEEFRIPLGDHPVVTEADILAAGALDLGWGVVTQAYRSAGNGNIVGLTSASFGITLNASPDDGTDSIYNRANLLVVEIENHYERGLVQTPVYGQTMETFAGQPTFTWYQTNSLAKPYPAFRLRVWADQAGTELVYDSGALRAPVRKADGAYSWTAPLYPNMMTSEGVVFKADTPYWWSVSMLDAKFTEPGSNETRASFAMQTTTPSGGVTDYGIIPVAVKYMGPGLVSTNTVANLMHIEAYETPDFAGRPMGMGYVTSVESMATEGSILVNAEICGLPALDDDGNAKKYYVLAYLDTDGDFARSDWESWGYGCYVNMFDLDGHGVYTPRVFNVVNRYAAGVEPDCVVYVDDCDTNNNQLPDVWEWNKYGKILSATDTDAAGVAAYSPYIVDPDHAYDTNIAIDNAIAKSGRNNALHTALMGARSGVITAADAIMLGGVDFDSVKEVKSVSIRSFSPESGLELDVVVDSAYENAAGFKVPVELEIEYATSLGGEWSKVGGSPATAEVVISSGVQTVASEDMKMKDGRTLAEAMAETREANPGACFFRVSAKVGK